MEILNTIHGTSNVSDIVFGVIFALGAVLLIVVSILAFLNAEIGAGVFAGVFGVLIGIVSYLAIGDGLEKSPTLYEVKITDYNEVFNNGYEIVEQRGDIHVIQKREKGAN